MIVVADASPLVALAVIDRLELLHSLYGEVAIPQSVHDEVMARGGGQPGAAEVQAAAWIIVHTDPLDVTPPGVHRGEAQAIELALRLRARLVILDDRQARRSAVRAGLTVKGIIGVLILAKDRGLVAELRPDLDRLRQVAGFWYSQRLYDEALHQAGE